MNNSKDVIAVTKAQVASKITGILTEGYKDSAKAMINLDQVSWIEEFDPDIKHKDGKRLYLAAFQTKGRIMIFRELESSETTELAEVVNIKQ